MQGKKNRFYSYLQLILLGFVFFSFSYKFSLQEGKLAFAYNTHNLGRVLSCEKLVQNPGGTRNSYTPWAYFPEKEDDFQYQSAI